MTVNQATIDLIKQFEGFRSETYKCSAGVDTIGYGTTAAADVGIDPAIRRKITKDEAEVYLHKAVNKFAAKVDELITVDVNANQFGAAVSLAYNIGPGAFARSTVLRELNAGHKDRAAAAFRMWNKAGGIVSKGLVNRREAEIELFLTPPTADMHAIEHDAPPSIWAAIINAILAIFKGSRT